MPVTIPFLKDWEECHRLVKIHVQDILQWHIERPLSVQRTEGRTFPAWTVQFATPGSMPVSGKTPWWRDE